MRSASRPGSAREVLAAAAIGALLLAAPASSGAGPRVRPGVELGTLWGGMSGTDRLASGGDDSSGPTGAFGAAGLELAWPGLWGMVTGLRYREVREEAPTVVRSFSGGIEYAYRLNTTLDLISLPALARVRAARIPALSLEVGPQLSWVTYAHSTLAWEPVGPAPGAALPPSISARPEALIFELVSADPTAHYSNCFVECVVGLALEVPGMAHPPFVTLRGTAGLTGVVGGSSGDVRRTRTLELGAGWRW